MKKLLLPILFLLLVMPGMTQNYNLVTITGTVTDISTGLPIPNHEVVITNDTMGGWIYYGTAWTDINGQYLDTVPVPLNTQGILHVRTMDCQNYFHDISLVFMPSVLNFTADFVICSIIDPCQAGYLYLQMQGLDVQFTDASNGGGTVRLWDFGDGSSSTELNPVHTYAQPGYYPVFLAIGAPGLTCFDTIISTIYVYPNGPGCLAAFTFVADTNNALNTYQFIDQSTGSNISSWHWDFGDPTSGTNNFSMQQNPIHTFAAAGTYNVCLTIQSSDSTCYDMVCATLVIGSGGGCDAAFMIVSDTANTSKRYFFDQSTGTNISSWTWDFGDGQSQVISPPENPNVSHTYLQSGIYEACLMIQSADSSCIDITCKTLFIGSGGGCQADYYYVADSTNASDIFHFFDQSTGNIASWEWNFGDPVTGANNFSYEQNPMHIFSAPGSYYVCLKVMGNDSTCNDMTCRTIVVSGGSGCQAAFLAVPDSMNTSGTYHFFDQSAGNIVSWTWNFGDPGSGVNNTSSLQNPYHIYSQPGTYQTCLTIQGADSACFDMICDTIVVGPGPGCQAYFSYMADPVHGSPFFKFTDLSTGNPTSWLWNFGDGTSSTQQSPEHEFPGTAPTYTVCLTITGNNCSSTFCKVVEVHDSSSYHQIYGQVYAGNFPISLGMAMIFSYETYENYQPYVAVCPIDSNGIYYFTLVPGGNYYIIAMPFDSNGYLPTYYGNTINWEQATLINLGTENNPYDIQLIHASQMTNGQGSASGQINTRGVRTSLMDKINMILMNEQGQPIGFTTVSSSGAFNFPSLAYGTYYLHPEMPGITSDQVKITLTPEQPHTDVVMTFSGKNILGIEDEVTLANRWIIYPNPVIDHLTVGIDMKQGTKAEIGIYNMTGQVISNTQVNMTEGSNKINLPAASLPAGIYSLRIYSAEGMILNTKFVKTR
ncbi:MAG: PKD domain-containing protein [Bacteroidetes bacterium]|nr:PKD domain-containing protein [Bacteroidota bacterium]